MKTLVIMPTYNERGSLPHTVARLLEAAPDVDVLIVDDRSPDGTGDIADSLAASEARVQVLHRRFKEGLGPAYISGFKWGLSREYDILVEMDADGSHRPEQLRHLLLRVERGADLALGSRWIPGGRVHNWPRHRLLLSRAGNLYVKLMLGLRVNDATAGFRAYRAGLVEYLLKQPVASQGYCFQVDLAQRTARAGFVIVEVPIDFDERAEGNSKMSRAIVVEALWRVTQWGLRYRSEQLFASIQKAVGRGRP